MTESCRNEMSTGGELSARERALSAMQRREYSAAASAAESAIAAMLNPDVSVARFVRRVLAGTHAQQLLRVNVAQIPYDRALREPFTLYWEALRRSGRGKEAADMRALCVRLWPERASVWAGAGNHALDEGDFAGALRYFLRGLERDPDSVTCLAGAAIAYETQKDWPRALACRHAVVATSGALERSDPPSLQRSIRYGMALARVGRTAEAGVQLRRCVSLGAYEALPLERPPLLRFFTQVLYSPGVLQRMLGSQPDPAGSALQRMGQREAAILAQVRDAVLAAAELTAQKRELLLGVCALEAGEFELAFSHFDAADTDAQSDVSAHYLLMASAARTASSELASITRFARQAALDVLRASAAGARACELDLLYAALTLQDEEGEAAAVLAWVHDAQPEGVPLRRWLSGRTGSVGGPLAALPEFPDEGDAFSRLLWWSAWRETQRRLGHPNALVAAAAPAARLAI